MVKKYLYIFLESYLSNDPKRYSDYCYLNIDSLECLHAWTQHNSNWSQISSFIKPMGPVFDTRWEREFFFFFLINTCSQSLNSLSFN